MRSPLKVISKGGLLSENGEISAITGTPMGMNNNPGSVGNNSLKMNSPRADQIKEYFEKKRKTGTSVQRGGFQ